MTKKKSKLITKHIDDVQPKTVDEHFEYLMKNDDCINSNVKEVTPDDLPEWYDRELFKAGQNYYQRNLFSLGAASFSGLVAVLAVPSILKVLIFTKQSSTPCTAFKRYLQTLLYIYTLYISDESDASSKWYKALNVVRWKHSSTSRKSKAKGPGEILQRDMALTQFGFIGYSLLQPHLLSLTNEPHERAGLNHFWRVVGHMLGISDRINICRKNEAETTQLCDRLMKEYFAKYVKDSPPHFLEMTKAMLDGAWAIDVALDFDSFLTMFYELTGLKYEKPLGLYSKCILASRRTVLYLLQIPYIGAIVRTSLNLTLRFVYFNLERWPVMAWIKFGKNNTKINLYPNIKY